MSDSRKKYKNKEEEEENTSYKVIINSRLTAKDIRDSLWHCRDFELSHLWQRSMFLIAIIVLSYGAYGAVVIELVKAECQNITGNNCIFILNSIALLLAALNIILSLFWIAMGKGSKAWYERYENAIVAFERNLKYVTKEVKSIGGFKYTSLTNYKYPKINNCFLSTSGGAYSPSRINIAIGQVALIIWCILFLFHICGLMEKFCSEQDCFHCLILVFLMLFFICVLYIVLGCSSWIKSSALGNK